MSEVLEWVRNMICFLCFFQVFLHLVPMEHYRKYLKFFGNLLLVFMVIRPGAAFLGKDQELDQILRMESLKGEYSELQMHMEGIEELKTGVVNQAFQTEIIRQIKEIPESYGMSVESLTVETDNEESLTSLTMRLKDDESGQYGEKIRNIKDEIQNIYGIPKNHMEISVQG